MGLHLYLLSYGSSCTDDDEDDAVGSFFWTMDASLVAAVFDATAPRPARRPPLLLVLSCAAVFAFIERAGRPNVNSAATTTSLPPRAAWRAAPGHSPSSRRRRRWPICVRDRVRNKKTASLFLRGMLRRYGSVHEFQWWPVIVVEIPWIATVFPNCVAFLRRSRGV